MSACRVRSLPERPLRSPATTGLACHRCHAAIDRSDVCSMRRGSCARWRKTWRARACDGRRLPGPRPGIANRQARRLRRAVAERRGYRPRSSGLQKLDRVAGWVFDRDLFPAAARRRARCETARHACFKRSTVATKSSTSIWMRFQPPGAGIQPIRHGLSGPAGAGLIQEQDEVASRELRETGRRHACRPRMRGHFSVERQPRRRRRRRCSEPKPCPLAEPSSDQSALIVRRFTTSVTDGTGPTDKKSCQ